MTYEGALREAIADVRTMNEDLRRYRDSLHGTKPTTGPRAQPRVKPRTQRDYAQEPYIPPWAIHRGEQG